MPRVRLLPFGFLMVAAITLAVPILLGAWAEVQPDSLLHDSYFVVLPWYVWLWLILAPLLFGLGYLSGQRFAGLEFRRLPVWLHLTLWVLGAGIMITPAIAVSVVHAASETYTVGYSADFEALERVLTLGYCVTLLSVAVFAICIGQAVLKRLRRGKEL